MTVAPALLDFSEEVLKGLFFFYRKHIEKVFKSSASETEAFIVRMSKLTKIMTSCILSAILKMGSPDLDFMNEWEAHAQDAKCSFFFLRSNTAEGVTWQSTLDLVQYLSSQCG